MKKYLSLAIVAVCIFASSLLLVGCGTNNTNKGNNGTIPQFVEVQSVRFGNTLMPSHYTFTFRRLEGGTVWTFATPEQFESAVYHTGTQDGMLHPASFTRNISQDRNIPIAEYGDWVTRQTMGGVRQRAMVIAFEVRIVSVKIHSDTLIEIKNADGSTILHETPIEFIVRHRDSNGNITRIETDQYDIRFFTEGA